MVTFKGLDKIEDVVIYKGDSVYVNRDDYDFGIINEDLTTYIDYLQFILQTSLPFNTIAKHLLAKTFFGA